MKETEESFIDRSELSVAVNATSPRVGQGGFGFLYSQLKAVEESCPELNVRVFAAPWNAERYRSGLGFPIVEVDFNSVWGRVFWEQRTLPRLVGSDEILYCPGNFVPLRGSQLTVLCVQNANYFGVGRRKAFNRQGLRRLKIAACHASIRRATRVIAISHALKEEIVSDLPQFSGKISVIHTGAPDWSDVLPQPIESVESPFVLSVASDWPHKRLDDVAGAWARAFGGRQQPPTLVFVGSVSPARQVALRALVPVPLRHRVQFLGTLAERSRMRWLMERAAAAVSLSELEAHPLTPAEVGALGGHLILSDIAAHREVAGDRAEFVKVGDVPAAARLLAAACKSKAPRRPWQWRVTWQEHAAALSQVFREARAARMH